MQVQNVRIQCSPEPVGIRIYKELDSEDDGERRVDIIQLYSDVGRCAVLVGHLVDNLGLDSVERKILRRFKSERV